MTKDTEQFPVLSIDPDNPTQALISAGVIYLDGKRIEVKAQMFAISTVDESTFNRVEFDDRGVPIVVQKDLGLRKQTDSYSAAETRVQNGKEILCIDHNHG